MNRHTISPRYPYIGAWGLPLSAGLFNILSIYDLNRVIKLNYYLRQTFSKSCNCNVRHCIVYTKCILYHLLFCRNQCRGSDQCVLQIAQFRKYTEKYNNYGLIVIWVIHVKPLSLILDKRNNISKNSANTVYQMDHMKYNKYSLVYESNVK